MDHFITFLMFFAALAFLVVFVLHFLVGFFSEAFKECDDPQEPVVFDDIWDEGHFWLFALFIWLGAIPGRRIRIHRINGTVPKVLRWFLHN